MRFHERLGAALEERGWGLPELSARSGVPVETVRAWFNRQSAPNPANLAKVADALGVPPAELGEPGAPVGICVGKGQQNRRREVLEALGAGATPAEAAVRFGVPEKAVERWARQCAAAPRPAAPAPKATVPDWQRLAMTAPSVRAPRCLVCGSSLMLEQHHVVRRSQGGTDGPTLTLCKACHRAVHDSQTLHFRWVPTRVYRSLAYGVGGHWEWLRTERATKDFDALSMEGWRRTHDMRG